MEMTGMRYYTIEEAKRERAEAKRKLDMLNGGLDIEEVNELADEYLLSPRERELWDRIDQLTWLIGNE